MHTIIKSATQVHSTGAKGFRTRNPNKKTPLNGTGFMLGPDLYFVPFYDLTVYFGCHISGSMTEHYLSAD